MLQRPVESAVVSGPSTSYQLSGRYRVHTGRSAANFQKPKFERLLFPKAVVQTTRKTLLRTSANGHKEPFASPKLWQEETHQSGFLMFG